MCLVLLFLIDNKTRHISLLYFTHVFVQTLKTYASNDFKLSKKVIIIKNFII